MRASLHRQENTNAATPTQSALRGRLMAMVVLPFLIIGMILYAPFMPVVERRRRKRVERFSASMSSRGRLVPWETAIERVTSRDGWLILDLRAPHGDLALWWTPTDLHQSTFVSDDGIPAVEIAAAQREIDPQNGVALLIDARGLLGGLRGQLESVSDQIADRTVTIHYAGKCPAIAAVGLPDIAGTPHTTSIDQ